MFKLFNLIISQLDNIHAITVTVVAGHTCEPHTQQNQPPWGNKNIWGGGTVLLPLLMMSSMSDKLLENFS